MKNIIFTALAIMLSVNAFAQRQCGSQLNLEEIQKTDQKRYQRIMDMESQLQIRLRSSRSLPAGIITIPVVIHVVYANNTENISDAQIKT